ncbi:uncharacterized protein LOC120923708 [Rana temporaria]|uniref:uncharacterized protein LOC120923708 n=1 Tax=Rana temporaria TaxID=8407 RepID=UPI001AACE747|nr:uncharacterized protein LOC120923708 [Rana temporaria]
MPSSILKNLEEIKSGSKCRGYHCSGELLSIEEIYNNLTSLDNIKTAGKTMKENIGKVRTDLSLRLPIDFPVMRLQHVTDWESLQEILKSKSFKGRGDHEREEFRDLSFWSADICPKYIESARQQAYDKVRRVRNAEGFQTEIKEQYASSPAFDQSASLYGNFRLSFPLSYLLSLYKTQHCGGEEPQLRILGTDIYKQEIAHYIVVHRPNADQFNDLPTVPPAQNISGRMPFVYWMEERLFWRPESTSRSLKLKISEKNCQVRPLDPPRSRRSVLRRKKRAYEPRCVWNALVVDFHLPGNERLQLPMSELLTNLTPCDGLQPFLGKTLIQRHEAKDIIRRLREEFSRQRTK